MERNKLLSSPHHYHMTSKFQVSLHRSVQKLESEKDYLIEDVKSKKTKFFNVTDIRELEDLEFRGHHGGFVVSLKN